MFRFLRYLLDNKALMDEAAALSERCENLEEALAREVDRNRARESALFDAIIRVLLKENPLANLPHVRMPDLRPEKQNEELRLTETTTAPPADTLFFNDQMIEQRALDFYEQAKAKGIDYDLEVLKEVIRRNPEKYLID